METVLKAVKTLAVLFSLYMVGYKPFSYLPEDTKVPYLIAVIILGWFIFHLLYEVGRSIPDDDNDLKS